jgi:hypothetical protein
MRPVLFNIDGTLASQFDVSTSGLLVYAPGGIFADREDELVWVVDVQSGPGFALSRPRPMFDLRGYMSGTFANSWDISPDGQRFLMTKMEDSRSRPVTELILIQNWLEEFKRLVSTRRW